MRLLRRGVDSEHDEILAHYRTVWPGRHIESVHWTPEHLGSRLPDLHIAKVQPKSSNDYWIFATIGAWRASEEGATGLEFVAIALSESAGVMAHLGLLAYFHAGPLENRLGVGHTVAIGEPWMPGSRLDAIVLSRPHTLSPKLEHCQLRRRHIQVLWAVPIDAAERALAREQGYDALEDRLSEAQIEVLDPDRPSVA